MIYPQKWTGSAEKGNKAGVAEFDISGNKHTLNLESFDSFWEISKMLESAFEDGKNFIKERAHKAVTRSLSNIDKW